MKSWPKVMTKSQIFPMGLDPSRAASNNMCTKIGSELLNIVKRM